MIKATVILIVALFIISLSYPIVVPILNFIENFGEENLQSKWHEHISNTINWLHWIIVPFAIGIIVWYAIYTQRREPWWR